MTALLLHGAVDRVGHILEVRAHIALLDHDHPRCREHVVIYGYACGVGGLFQRLGGFPIVFHRLRAPRSVNEVHIVRSRVSGIHKRVEVF